VRPLTFTAASYIVAVTFSEGKWATMCTFSSLGAIASLRERGGSAVQLDERAAHSARQSDVGGRIQEVLGVAKEAEDDDGGYLRSWGGRVQAWPVTIRRKYILLI